MTTSRRDFVYGMAATAALANTAPAQAKLKRVLAIGDVTTGYQHDSVSHALATMERLGRERNLFDLTIRTDSQLITKQKLTQGNAHNLDTFDALFFFGVGPGTLTAQQKADLLSFVHDDGKAFIAAHTGTDAFFDWPEYGELIGGYFDDHPWGQTDGRVLVERPAFPGWSGLGMSFAIHDEFYQTRAPYARDKVDVIARLDTTQLDMTNPKVRRHDADYPVAWCKTYGKGRVFWSTLGHAAATWDDTRVQEIYVGAMKWGLGFAEYTPQPHGMPQKA